MCQGERLESVLRLLALMSATGGGLPKKHFDALRREVLHTYGHENILTLSAMQDAGGCRALALAHILTPACPMLSAEVSCRNPADAPFYGLLMIHYKRSPIQLPDVACKFDCCILARVTAAYWVPSIMILSTSIL